MSMPKLELGLRTEDDGKGTSAERATQAWRKAGLADRDRRNTLTSKC